jgi:SAM-dependent methyltransferase
MNFLKNLKFQVKNMLVNIVLQLKDLLSGNNVENFAEFQRAYYDEESENMSIKDHSNHNLNPNLWLIGYGPLRVWPSLFENGICLDFACGTGRNMTNLQNLKIFSEIHGADISSNNLNNARKKHISFSSENQNYFYHLVDGKSVKISTDRKFNFVFSTIALQHIPIHKTRLRILSDLSLILADDGILSFQMGFGDKNFGGSIRTGSVSYYRNFYSAKGTNGRHDVRVSSPEQIIDDLKFVGIPYTKIFITDAWDDRHPYWIWVWASKKPFSTIKL